MQLQPKRPPGRVDRKAAAYASEIVRLRADGYTYETIRDAIAEVGIQLSESTLRREVRRQQKRVIRALPGARPVSPVLDNQAISEQQTPPPEPSPSMSATGREIAETFFTAHPSNPLFPIKEAS